MHLIIHYGVPAVTEQKTTISWKSCYGSHVAQREVASPPSPLATCRERRVGLSGSTQWSQTLPLSGLLKGEVILAIRIHVLEPCG